MAFENIRKKISAIKNFNKNWKLKNPNEKWEWLYNVASIGTELIGVKIFTTNKVTLYSYSAGLFIAIYFISVINAFVHYTMQGQLFHGLIGVGIAAIVVPVGEKKNYLKL